MLCCVMGNWTANITQDLKNHEEGLFKWWSKQPEYEGWCFILNFGNPITGLQEFLCFQQSPKFHYNFYKLPSLNTLANYVAEYCMNTNSHIIHPPKLWYPKWSSLQIFPIKTLNVTFISYLGLLDPYGDICNLYKFCVGYYKGERRHGKCGRGINSAVKIETQMTDEENFLCW